MVMFFYYKMFKRIKIQFVTIELSFINVVYIGFIPLNLDFVKYMIGNES